MRRRFLISRKRSRRRRIEPAAFFADVACFAATDFPASCTWLDSQARIEDSLGVVNIVATEVTACSPLVFYAGKGISGR